jgi:phosphoenolpyruvate-protein kinase (PTS system EI component)
VSTRDGLEVTVLANVASVADADLAIAMAAPGVGLLRTEMPFLNAEHWPTYAEHVARLEPVLRRLTGLAVTVRTLDFADDKLPPFLRAGRTGTLGRSLPLMLAEPDAFSAQIRAILHTGLDCGVSVRIMVPMVVTPDELGFVRGLAATAATELSTPTPPVGAMIELPEAVTAVDAIAAKSDFLSIGSNDLTASILGLGRRDPSLVTTRILEPAVLDAMESVVQAGRRHRRAVSVCGDAASDPSTVPALVGRGCSTLSVAPSMMDEVRAVVRSL